MPRKNFMHGKPWAAEVRHLMIDCHWSSRSMATYIKLRYEEDFPHTSYDNWRRAHLAQLRRMGKLPAHWERPTGDTADDRMARLRMPEDVLPDLVMKRLALIAMQEERIAVDVAHELQMGKLFNTGRAEIELLNKLYNDLREELQLQGLWPSREAAPGMQINVAAQAAAGALMATGTDDRSLEELMPGTGPEDRRALGRALVLVTQDQPPAEQ